MVATDHQKIYARRQDYSPKAQTFGDAMEFWTRIVKREKIVLTNRAALRLLAKQVQILLKTPKTIVLKQVDA